MLFNIMAAFKLAFLGLVLAGKMAAGRDFQMLAKESEPLPAEPKLQSKDVAYMQRDRKLMQQAGQGALSSSTASTQGTIPASGAPTISFAKISASSSKPLGTALNGSAWMPGACGPAPSALGYQCSWPAPGGAVLHWTYSSSSGTPPINRCTMQQQAVPNLEIQEVPDAVVHFALQAATQDKMHLAFVDREARLFPSEGIHGKATDPCNNGILCNSTSTPQVEVLYHSTPEEWWVTSRPSSRDAGLMEGWAGWASADTDGITQVLCISRRLHTKLMKLGPQQAADLLVEYAVGGGSNYMGDAKQKGMVSVNLLTGQVSEVQPPNNYLLAHGALMLIAFGVLLPLGLLLARHKWLFIDEDKGLNPLWALAHLAVLLVSALTGLTGMIVALVRFGNTVSGMVMSTHQVLGLLSVGLSLVLVIMYGLRPFLVTEKHAPSPLLGPQKVGGVVTVAAGWTSLFLGCVVIHQNWAVPYITWLLPCILLTALVAAAATALELRYQKLVRRGDYNPKTCTLSNSGPRIPLARIRTHRDPLDLKKHEMPSAGGNDGQPGSPGRAGGLAAAMLARSTGGQHLQHREGGDAAGSGGRRGSSSAGSYSSNPGSSGGSGDLYFRRGGLSGLLPSSLRPADPLESPHATKPHTPAAAAANMV